MGLFDNYWKGVEEKIAADENLTPEEVADRLAKRKKREYSFAIALLVGVAVFLGINLSPSPDPCECAEILKYEGTSIKGGADEDIRKCKNAYAGAWDALAKCVD